MGRFLPFRIALRQRAVMLRCMRRETANSSHLARIRERPVETKSTVNQGVSNAAAPAGCPGYTVGSVSPLPVRRPFKLLHSYVVRGTTG